MNVRIATILMLLLLTAALSGRKAIAMDLVVIQGAAGEPRYQEQFSEWADGWSDISSHLQARLHRIHQGSPSRSAREECFETLGKFEGDGNTPLWLVLIGHGTFAQDQAKFNLVGPDISAGELSERLQEFRRPTLVVNGASASGPFIDRLSGINRIVITATKSGHEQNFARFGGDLVSMASHPASDLDHDGSVSLLEAFLAASKATAQHYRDQGLLATEHPMIDDNGDRTGTTADFFRGIRVARRSSDAPAVDGNLAHQWTIRHISREPELKPESKQRRDRLESQLEQLRRQKKTISEDDYYAQIEPLLVEIAMLYESEVHRRDPSVRDRSIQAVSE
ncbi:MAG: hypothetical protein CMJ80_06025 [Planctomycetaceae bacterium]|nr:hypothetical protein [Planctomycetaceae bacterium]